MVKGDYSEAMMKLETWQKDMTIIADFARKAGCPTPLFSASAPLYAAAMAMGQHAHDTAAVCPVLEDMANHHRLPGASGRAGRAGGAGRSGRSGRSGR
jgi:L-threonate 2-dehydrogenase